MVVLAVLGIIAVLAALAALAGWSVFLQPDHPVPAAGQPVKVVVERGATTPQIAESLSAAGVVPNARMFLYKVRQSGADSRLKAGTYELTTGAGYEAAISKLVAGPPKIVYYDVVIPEGFTGKKIAARFAKRAHVSEEEMLELIENGAPTFAKEHPYLKDAHGDSLEGFLFPATYRIKKGSTPEQIVEKMLDTFDERIAQVDLSYAASKNLTLTDVVTIASMIEGEAKLDKEYPLVASVVYNRLKAKMRLQLCMTVLYTLPKHKSALTNADLRTKSEYNTYLRKGLPPGPVGNPGMKTLEAAAKPKKTKYLYYVLTGKDGSHTFATNYADFLKAKQVYKEKIQKP